MISAIDTAILLDVFSAETQHVGDSQKLLRRALREGGLVICEVVVAEMRPCFSNHPALLNALETLEITISPINHLAALLAGETWKSYRSAGGARDHSIADFLIGAHASMCADRLLTRDRDFYQRWFRRLTILEED